VFHSSRRLHTAQRAARSPLSQSGTPLAKQEQGGDTPREQERTESNLQADKSIRPNDFPNGPSEMVAKSCQDRQKRQKKGHHSADVCWRLDGLFIVIQWPLPC